MQSVPVLPALHTRYPSKTQSFLLNAYNSDAVQSLKKLSDISARRKQLDVKLLSMPQIPQTVATKVTRKVKHAAKELEFEKRSKKLDEHLSEDIFLCAGATRFFWVDMKDKVSDLVVQIKYTSGRGALYASYNYPTPGPNNYDIVTFKNKLVLPFTEERAKRERCNLAVTSRSEVEAVIECSFLGELTQLPNKSKKSSSKIPEVLLRLNRIRYDKLQRDRLDASVADILMRRSRSKALSQDFISLNKTYTSSSKMSSEDIDGKLIRVRQKRLELNEEKATTKRAFMDRRKIREIATVKAKRIHSICQRKSNFEQMWLTNLYAVLTVETLHSRFSKIKVEVLQQKLEFCMVLKVQRTWKRYQGKELDFETRLLLQTRNTCLFWRDHMKALVDFRNDRTLVQCMRDSAYIYKAPSRFDWFINLVLRIQLNWHQIKVREQRRMELLRMQWNKAMDGIVNGNVLKYRRKRRKQLTEKYLSIPAELREELLGKHYQKCKLAFHIKFIEDEDAFFTFLFSSKGITELIYKASKINAKRGKLMLVCKAAEE
jgi:hypothetical protein